MLATTSRHDTDLTTRKAPVPVVLVDVVTVGVLGTFLVVIVTRTLLFEKLDKCCLLQNLAVFDEFCHTLLRYLTALCCFDRVFSILKTVEKVLLRGISWFDEGPYIADGRKFAVVLVVSGGNFVLYLNHLKYYINQTTAYKLFSRLRCSAKLTRLTRKF